MKFYLKNVNSYLIYIIITTLNEKVYSCQEMFKIDSAYNKFVNTKGPTTSYLVNTIWNSKKKIDNNQCEEDINKYRLGVKAKKDWALKSK